MGAVLRLMQYLADPALSLDELAVARNVLERNVWDLLVHPLAYDQTAPKGFLLATKLATSIFGASDYALRLFPLICSLASQIAFWRVALRILGGAGAPRFNLRPSIMLLETGGSDEDVRLIEL